MMSKAKRSSSSLRVRPQPALRIGKSERTRAALLNAAFDFMWTRPFRDMTVSAVTGTAGVSRSAFYHYFNDLHDLMETLLGMLQEEIFNASNPWLTDVGDPVALLGEAITGLVRVCHERGPLVRAVSDATATDRRLELAWIQFLGGYDDAGSARIEADQKQGLIPDFDARPMAIALNRLNASTLIHAFGQRPRSEPEPVREALVRVWISSLYGSKWIGNESSDLLRK